MNIDGDRLVISLDSDIEELDEIFDFVKDRVAYIETIEVDENIGHFKTSALFAFLASVKKTKPTISIPLIDNNILKLKDFGTIHWKTYE